MKHLIITALSAIILTYPVSSSAQSINLDAFKSMSMDQKEAIFDSLSPETKKALQKRAQNYMSSLSAKERNKVKTKARKHMKKMTPQQRAKLRSFMMNR